MSKEIQANNSVGATKGQGWIPPPPRLINIIILEYIYVYANNF